MQKIGRRDLLRGTGCSGSSCRRRSGAVCLKVASGNFDPRRRPAGQRYLCHRAATSSIFAVDLTAGVLWRLPLIRTCRYSREERLSNSLHAKSRSRKRGGRSIDCGAYEGGLIQRRLRSAPFFYVLNPVAAASPARSERNSVPKRT